MSTAADFFIVPLLLIIGKTRAIIIRDIEVEEGTAVKFVVMARQLTCLCPLVEKAEISRKSHSTDASTIHSS